MIAEFNASLNPKASIYRELSKKPEWWKQLLSIEGVYVEIRKEDIVEVYYEGGCIAKLQYKKGNIIATCHPKYLGKTVPKGTSPKYEDCSELLKNNPDFIIKKYRKTILRRVKRRFKEI